MISKFQKYMTDRKLLLPGSLIVSGLSSIMTIMPLIYIWRIIREIFQNPNSFSFDLIYRYAWYGLGTALAGIFLYFTALMLSHLAAFRVETEMRRRAMAKIVSLPLGFFDANTSGKVRKIIDDNAGITHTFLAHQLPDLAGSVVMLLATIVLIFVFDWRLGLACAVPMATVMAIMGFMDKQNKHFLTEYLDSLEVMNTEAVEYVRGIPIVKVFQQTIYSFKNFSESIIRYKEMVIQYCLKNEKTMSLYVVLIHGLAYFLIPVTIIVMGTVATPVEIISNLLFYIILTPILAQYIMRSMRMNQAANIAGEAVTRMEELLEYETLSVPDSPKKIKNNEIEFQEVSFTYPNTDNKALDLISFVIPEGKTYALVGASGSGKTTVARLVVRFWDVDSGQVLIGGANVKDVAQKDLMENVSFVFQNPDLFKTTLYENIVYGNENATLEDVLRAAKLAQCQEFLTRLPEGLDTKIGVEGTYLSGGEQQRIALARAILKDAPIIVLDEATAFADPENEHLIRKGLDELTKSKTVLMIAHRLTSVMDVDRILVMDKGTIIEQGNHDELLNQQGVYANMWKEYQKSFVWTIGGE